jgi:hypothetical protein
MKSKLGFAAMAALAAFTRLRRQAGKRWRRSRASGSMKSLWRPMQRGTDMSRRRTAMSMNARSRLGDDWCDYSLDLQKRLDPNTGLITRDSSNYNHTWVNEPGDRLQTNNIDANPNGNGTGSWTLQENVR